MINVNLCIDGINIAVPPGSTILEAAKKADVNIPTLCNYKNQSAKSNCRICLVEVDGFSTLQPSCSMIVSEGMEVRTNTEKVRSSRKMSLKLMLSNHSWDCHHCLRIGNYGVEELDKTLCGYCFFCDCVKDGDCELQALAEEYDIAKLPFEWFGNPYPIDDSTHAVVRNPNKCIKCGRCIEACSIEQSIDALGKEYRGSKIQVSPTLGKALVSSSCVKCGKCIDACPTGAIYAEENYEEMLYSIRLDNGKKTAVYLSPFIIGELSRLLDKDERDFDLRKLAAGLKKIGVDYVFSEDSTNAMVKQKALEALADRLSEDGPIIMTNNPAAVEFLKNEFASLSDSTVFFPSAEQLFGKTIKTEWASRNGWNPESLCTITFSKSVSYKAEALKDDMKTNGVRNVDFVLTPREIARLLNKTAVEIDALSPYCFDSLPAFEVDNDSEWANLFYEDTNCSNERDIVINGKEYKVLTLNSLGEVRKQLDEVAIKKIPYKIILLRL